MEGGTSHHKRMSVGSRRPRGPRPSVLHEEGREKRHRKSHKRRRHRSRPRSRSNTRSLSPLERRAPVVYMNPAFQPFYGSVSGPAQSDMELRSTLLSQLSASEQRISSLEAELKAAQLARGRAEQTVFEVNAEKFRLESQNSEIVQVMRTLERGVEELQKANNALKSESDRRRKDMENAEKNISSIREQNSFLEERNMKLVKKCEELCAENKAILSRRDESAKELADMRPRMEGLQLELRQRIDDGRKLIVQLRTFEEKERQWMKEKSELEKRIEIKDAVAIAERKNTEEWKKKVLAEKTELERKVKLAEPEIKKALDSEAIKKAVEDIRAYYDQKLDAVLNEVNTLRKKCLNGTRYPQSLTSSNTVSECFQSDSILSVCRPGSAPPSSCSSNGAFQPNSLSFTEQVT